MATVLFTSNNYSSGSCVFTPSDPNHSQKNLGSITFPYTFDPLQHSLPQDIIEGAFEFTTSGCVFTKTVTRPATTQATAATTQATSGSGSGTGATAATTQATSGSGSGTGGTDGTLATAATTLATAATTLATAATTQATAATTVANPPRYEMIDDNTDGGAEIGEVFQFRVKTTNVKEGTSVGFNYLQGDLDNSFRRVEEGREPFEGDQMRIRIGPDGVGILHLEVLKAAGYIEIVLEFLDTDGNATRELTHLVKLLEPAATSATEATTLATSATEATTLATSATEATTLATSATEATTLATSATEATTLATSATEATTQAMPEMNYLFSRCSSTLEGPEQIILSGGEWEIYYGELPGPTDTMEHRDTGECYDFTSGTSEEPDADIREYTRNLCVCEGGDKGPKPEEPGEELP